MDWPVAGIIIAGIVSVMTLVLRFGPSKSNGVGFGKMFVDLLKSKAEHFDTKHDSVIGGLKDVAEKVRL